MALVNQIPYRLLDENAMIPIPQAYLDCAVYIYRTKADAKTGSLSGGSGFLTAIPLEINKEKHKLYVVTARHVIDKMKNPIVRLNLKAGGSEPLETNRARWIDHPDGDDLSVYPLPIEPDDDEYQFDGVLPDEFVDRSRNTAIFPGDEVFMVGRFFSHEGKEKNAPAVRFGNISMMAIETMEGRYNKRQETYLVEQRSLPGYSGSPVFVMLDSSQPRPPYWMAPPNRIGKLNIKRSGPWLLGIDWVHIHSYEPILKKDTTGRMVEVSSRKTWVKAHTGMAGVIPAWRLSDILMSEELKMGRRKDDERMTQDKKNTTHLTYDSLPKEESDTQTTSAGYEMPIPIRDQVLSDMGKASRRRNKP
jgi:hypothetical protein